MKNKDSSNIGWGLIITEFVSCVFCPFLIIPIWFICSRLENTNVKQNVQNALPIIYFLAIMFILAVSPIIAVVGTYTFGFQETFEECGFCFAVIIFEIHMALLHLWKTQIRPKIIPKPPKERKSLSDTDNRFLQIVLSILIMAFPFCFLYLLFSHGGMDFFITLFFIYGFTSIYWICK